VQHFPKSALDGVVLPSWRDTVREEQEARSGSTGRTMSAASSSGLSGPEVQEVWVEGASAFRNPRQDMPANWQYEAQRIAYYQVLTQPVQVSSFIDPLRERLTQALIQFNRELPRNRTCTSRPRGERSASAVCRGPLDAQPETPEPGPDQRPH